MTETLTITVAPAPIPPPAMVELSPAAVAAQAAVKAEPENLTVTEAVSRSASTAWNFTKCSARVLNGIRTLLYFGTTGILALGAKFADVDISGFLSRLTGEQITPADIIVFMSVSGIVLRWVTTTPVFTRWKKAATGAIKDDASSAVDDPEDTTK